MEQALVQIVAEVAMVMESGRAKVETRHTVMERGTSRAKIEARNVTVA